MTESKTIVLNQDYRMRKAESMNKARFKALEDRVKALEALVLPFEETKQKKTPKGE